MRIIQTPVRFFPAVGGVEKYVLDLSEQLVKLGYEIEVICANEPKSDIKEIEGINIRRLGYVFKLTNTNITPSLPFEIMATDFDLIHTHMPTPWSADISIFVGKLKKKKTIITIHNDIDKTSLLSKIMTSVYLHTMFLLSLCIVDKIIIVNESWEESFSNTKSILKRYKDKIAVLPNGVNIELFKPLDIQHERNTVLFVSILDKHHKFKGLDYLLQAIRKAKKSIPDIRLVIVGDGDLKKQYINKAKVLDVWDNVEFLGEKKPQDLVKIYNKSSILVLPSTEIEGFGIVTIEAMACKIPVIVTQVVALSDDILAHNAGEVVPERDPSALASAICRILQNPTLGKVMGERGLNLVRKKYLWSKLSLSVAQIYKEVLE